MASGGALQVNMFKAQGIIINKILTIFIFK
jgi:hypothetical protein